MENLFETKLKLPPILKQAVSVKITFSLPVVIMVCSAVFLLCCACHDLSVMSQV